MLRNKYLSQTQRVAPIHGTLSPARFFQGMHGVVYWFTAPFLAVSASFEDVVVSETSH